ncbi:MAG: CRISPR-associated endonuclease Cas2 [bacterium]|nr:CRISPR-associated endonuclease Cas2 [bacterium]
MAPKKKRVPEQRVVRGAKTKAILEALEGAALSVMDLGIAMLVLPCGASRGSFERVRGELVRDRELAKESSREWQRYWSMLTHLKKTGLVAETRVSGGAAKLILTKFGLERLVEFRSNLAVSYAPDRYRGEPSKKVVIVAFDVPERERRKRDWLRAVLIQLGFHKVQQSVFVGKVVIPQVLLDNVAELGLIPHIQIFSVTERGTLRSLV